MDIVSKVVDMFNYLTMFKVSSDTTSFSRIIHEEFIAWYYHSLRLIKYDVG